MITWVNRVLVKSFKMQIIIVWLPKSNHLKNIFHVYFQFQSKFLSSGDSPENRFLNPVINHHHHNSFINNHQMNSKLLFITLIFFLKMLQFVRAFALNSSKDFHIWITIPLALLVLKLPPCLPLFLSNYNNIQKAEIIEITYH